MVKKMKPANRPQMNQAWAETILKANGIDLTKPAILGMRGYFQDSMGTPGRNDRGIYDDATIVISPSV